MGKRLQTVEEHVTDIVISTATVDIQVMRIGTKQMTLAVFRQLPYEEIFDNQGRLLAPPWGWVNYDREGDPKPFVFSYQGILYRCKVNVKRHHQLIAKAQSFIEDVDARYDTETQKWIPRHEERVVTGKWIITPKTYDYDYPDCPLLFTTEAGARVHLANRMEGIAVLESAPQLFIGV